MFLNYTAHYIKIDSGYMGQLVEWPEVVTEGEDLEVCRLMLRDALQEMVLAYDSDEDEMFFRPGDYLESPETSRSEAITEMVLFDWNRSKYWSVSVHHKSGEIGFRCIRPDK